MDKIIEISKKLGHSHIGSSLTAWPIIEEIFRLKKPYEKFILSNGHAGLALAIKLHGDKAEELIKENIHADRKWCDASTGSLGHGLGIAVGMALSDRTKNVYVMLSDGECAEGSVWESLRIAREQKLANLKVYVAANGWASYQPVDVEDLEMRLNAFFPVEFRYIPQQEPFTGLEGHYAKAK